MTQRIKLTSQLGVVLSDDGAIVALYVTRPGAANAQVAIVDGRPS